MHTLALCYQVVKIEEEKEDRDTWTDGAKYAADIKYTYSTKLHLISNVI